MGVQPPSAQLRLTFAHVALGLPAVWESGAQSRALEAVHVSRKPCPHQLPIAAVKTSALSITSPPAGLARPRSRARGVRRLVREQSEWPGRWSPGTTNRLPTFWPASRGRVRHLGMASRLLACNAHLPGSQRMLNIIAKLC